MILSDAVAQCVRLDGTCSEVPGDFAGQERISGFGPPPATWYVAPELARSWPSTLGRHLALRDRGQS